MDEEELKEIYELLEDIKRYLRDDIDKYDAFALNNADLTLLLKYLLYRD